MTRHEDTLLPLIQAVDLLPRFRSGRPPTIESVRRWVRTGRLEARRIGRTYFTTRDAIDRFLRFLEDPQIEKHSPPRFAAPTHGHGAPGDETASGCAPAPRSATPRL